MAIKIDTDLLTSNKATLTNTMISESLKYVVMPQFSMHDGNKLGRYSDTSGDAPIGHNTMQVDEDLLIVSSWGGGLSIHRIDDAGAIAMVYQDLYPQFSYAYYNALAIDKVRKVAYIAGLVHDGIVAYDYSGAMNGGTVVTKIGQLTEAADGLPSDEVGDHYINGLALAGDWLYFGPDDNWATGQMRWNVVTKQAETITVVNKRNNSMQGAMVYSEATDRIYNLSNYDGEIWVTVNASTATPTTYNLRVQDLGLGNDMYNVGVVEDKDNPNHVWLATHFRVTKFDITDCITEPVAANVVPTIIGGSTDDLRYGNHLLKGHVKFDAPHPDYTSDFIMMHPDRGHIDVWGWYDQENNQPVAIANRDGLKYDKDPLTYDYGWSPALISSANGTKYWVASGYGWDGHGFNVYPETTKPELYTSAEIVFGPYSFDDNSNIRIAMVDDVSMYIPSGCNVTYYISNNNGSTWESFAGTGTHVFSSEGNQVKVKITMTGLPNKTPYITQKYPPQIAIIGKEKRHKRAKRFYKRLRGRKR